MSTWEEYSNWVEQTLKTLFVGITSIFGIYLIISNFKQVSNLIINISK